MYRGVAHDIHKCRALFVPKSNCDSSEDISCYIAANLVKKIS